jgi:hypothetical protein
MDGVEKRMVRYEACVSQLRGWDMRRESFEYRSEVRGTFGVRDGERAAEGYTCFGVDETRT